MVIEVEFFSGGYADQKIVEFEASLPTTSVVEDDMTNKIMKTLAIGENTYEIYDESARTDIVTAKADIETLKTEISQLQEEKG